MTAPADPAGIVGATMIASRGGLMFGGPGNNSFLAAGPGAYDMVGGTWVNSFTISPSFGGVPATYQIDGGGGESQLVVKVPAGDIADFENGTVPDKYDPAYQALDIYSNAGLFATAQGINEVIPVGAVGATIILGDTSELNIDFNIQGSGRIVFGGSPAPDSFSVTATYPLAGADTNNTAEHRTAAFMYPLVANAVFGDKADWFFWYPGDSGYESVYAEGPFYSVSRIFGTNGRTQDVELTVNRVADTSITLDGRGGSDQYQVVLGLGTFLNVTVADSDPSTQNSLVVDARQTGFFNDRVTLTDTSLKVEYYTPILYMYYPSAHYASSVAYAPTIFFGANTDITFATAYPFEQTIIDRVAGPQNATILIDGHTLGDIGDFGGLPQPIAYDPDQPNAVAHFSHTVTGIAPTLDIQASAGNLVADLYGYLNVNVMANTGHLTFNDSQPWTGTADTYTVVDNAGQLDVNYDVNAAPYSINGYLLGLVHTLNILANSGVINLQDTVNPAVVNPGGVGIIDAQVNVGSSGSLADVHGVINLSGSNGHLGLTLDDRTDAGSDLPWAIDADNTTIGDLTVNYVMVNSIHDYSSKYQAFSNPGSTVAVLGDPPFFGRVLNGNYFPSWTLDGPSALYNHTGDAVSIPPSVVDDYSLQVNTFTASGLPPGLSIDSTTGVISGVVDAQAPLGVYHTRLTASDGSFTRSKRIDWHITQITLNVPSNYLNLVGESVNLLVTATSPSPADITFSATNLPDGLSIDPATGQISGTVVSAVRDLQNIVTTITATQGSDVSAKSFQWSILPAGFVDDITVNTPNGDAIADQITLEGEQGDAGFYARNSLYQQLPLLVSVAGLPPGVAFDTEYAADFQFYQLVGIVAAGAASNSPYHVTVTATDGRWSQEVAFDWFVAVQGVNTVSLPKPGGGGDITVTSPDGTSLSAAITQDAGVALPTGIAFPFGFLEFAFSGLSAGDFSGPAAATVTISGLDTSGITDYYKYGVTPDDPADPHWYSFLDDTQTGMEIVDGNLVLHFVDSKRGDDDLAWNGTIFDIGGPTAPAGNEVNNPPTSIALSNNSVAENKPVGTAVGLLSGTDPDAGQSATLTFSLVSNYGDNAQFSIDSASKQLNTAAIFNYETKNSYSIEVRATDSGNPGLTYDQLFTVSVTDVNEQPTAIALSNNSVAENKPVGTAVGLLSGTDPDAGQSATLTFSLVGGYGDNAQFSIDSASKQLNTAAIFNYETKNSYSIEVRATDSGNPGLTYDQLFTIAVTDVNEQPTAIALSNNSVAENKPVGTAVGLLSGTDPDAGQSATLTFSLVSNYGDNAQFSIDSASKQLNTAAIFNYETKNSYSIEVRATDSGNPGLTYDQLFTITVTDVNEQPTAIALSNNSVAENKPVGTAVGLLSGTDPDAGQSATLTFSLVSGYGDNALFTIDPASKQLKTAAIFNYETKNSYSIEVRATDSGNPGLTYDQLFMVSVTDVNEQPTAIALSNSSVAENQPVGTAVGLLSGTDPDAGQSATLTFSLVSGYGDNALFTIDPASKQLKTAAIFDYETKNSYSIEVRATDSGNPGLTYDQLFTIAVTDVNEQPTAIALSNNSVAENKPLGTAVGLLSGTDPDAGQSATLTFSLVSNYGDNAQFSIDSASKQLKTAAIFDYETKNSYSIEVRATDSGNPGLTYDQLFTIAVTDVNEQPTAIALSNNSVAENKPLGTAVGLLSGTDPDAGQSATLTFSLVSNYGDNAQFSIDSASKQLNTAAIFNYETKNSYSIEVRATDSGNPGLTYDQLFTVSVTDVNEQPTAIALSNNSVAENKPVGTAVGLLSGTDPDAGQSATLTFSLVGGYGDNAQFSIDSASKQLNTAAIFNYETKNSYSIEVRATDSGNPGLTYDQLFTVSVTDVNEQPTAIALSNNSVAENKPVGTAVGLLSGTDPDAGQSATLTFSLVGGYGDNAQFSIDSASKQLNTAAIFNYETKNSYSIEVRATDSGNPGLTYDQLFTIAVTDVNEQPTAIALSNNSVAENKPVGTAVGLLSGTDPDAGQSATLTFSLVSGYGDNALFTIDPASKQLKTAAIFNYETKNSYSIEVRATDSGNPGLTYDQLFTVSVTDVNEQPTAIALSNNSVAENKPVGTAVGLLSGTDPDAGQSATLTFSLVGGYGDNAQFSIDSASKQLKTAAIFALTASHSIEVRATDSGNPGLTYDQPFTITVNAPVAGAITGKEYLDVTGNGLTADDTPLANVNVEVYLDTNNSGSWNTGEPFTTTLADGTYAFTALAAGTYKVRQVVPTGYVRTAPATSDYYNVTLSAGQTSSGNNFANAQLGNPAVLTNIVYVINGTTPVSNLSGSTHEGDTVEVSFTVVAGAQPQRFTLLTYTAPAPRSTPTRPHSRKCLTPTRASSVPAAIPWMFQFPIASTRLILWRAGPLIAWVRLAATFSTRRKTVCSAPTTAAPTLYLLRPPRCLARYIWMLITMGRSTPANGPLPASK